MSDRVRTLTIVLDEEYRKEDVQNIVQAISMVKGVFEVKVGESTPDFLARSAIRSELWDALLNSMYVVLYPDRRQ